jgi:hypothetical protein
VPNTKEPIGAQVRARMFACVGFNQVVDAMRCGHYGRDLENPGLVKKRIQEKNSAKMRGSLGPWVYLEVF